jgi:hypothetical protein
VPPLTVPSGITIFSVTLSPTTPARESHFIAPWASTGIVSCIASESRSESALTVIFARPADLIFAFQSMRFWPSGATLTSISFSPATSMPSAASSIFTSFSPSR